MKLIIDIDDKVYNDLKNRGLTGMLTSEECECMNKSIYNGTPFPKCHGRLIDADALEKKMCDREQELGDDRAIWESSAVSVALDMFAPTIIEADKENKE